MTSLSSPVIILISLAVSFSFLFHSSILSILIYLKGTSTGGIIAILLSRLRLDVPSCIKIYTALAEEVFKNDRSTKFLGIQLRIAPTRFSGLILEKAIKSVLRDSGFDPEERMWDDTLFEYGRDEPDRPGRQATNQLPKLAVAENGKPQEVPQDMKNKHKSTKPIETGAGWTQSMPLRTRKNTDLDEPIKGVSTATKKKYSGAGCHGLVVAVYKHAVGLPKLFLTNDPNDKETRVWQALRATSAAPTFFEEMTFGVPRITYIDGGLGYNSPCVEIDAQAKSIWEGRAVGCIVSIGTGLQTIPDIQSTGWLPFRLHNDLSTAAAIVQMATSTTRVDNEMQRMYRDTETEYYRWDVDTGLGGISLEQWMKEDEMASATQRYMEDPDQSIRKTKLANTIARLSAGPKVIECSAGRFRVGMKGDGLTTRDLANPTIPCWLLEDLDLKTGFPLGMDVHPRDDKDHSGVHRSTENVALPVEMDLDGDGNRSEAQTITCCWADDICLRTVMSSIPQGRYSIRFIVCFYNQDPLSPVDSPQTRNFRNAWPRNGDKTASNHEPVNPDHPINLIFSIGKPYDPKTFTHRYIDPVISPDIVPVLLHPDAIRVRIDENMWAEHQGKGWFEIQGDVELDVGLEGGVGIVISKILEKERRWIGGWSFGGVRLVPA